MKRIGIFLFGLFAVVARADLLPMDNNELRTVEGRNGVALALDLGLNISNAGATSSTPAIPKCSPSGSSIPCRIGIQLNNRDNLALASAAFVNAYGGTGITGYSNGTGKGWWLVYKNFYGRITAPRITLDAGAANYNNKSGSATSVPALVMSTNDLSGNPTPIILNNINIQNMSVEVDSASSSVTPQAPANLGYENPSETGFLSLKVNDLTGLTIRGSVTMFACQSNHPSC